MADSVDEVDDSCLPPVLLEEDDLPRQPPGDHHLRPPLRLLLRFHHVRHGPVLHCHGHRGDVPDVLPDGGGAGGTWLSNSLRDTDTRILHNWAKLQSKLIKTYSLCMMNNKTLKLGWQRR